MWKFWKFEMKWQAFVVKISVTLATRTGQNGEQLSMQPQLWIKILLLGFVSDWIKNKY